MKLPARYLELKNKDFDTLSEGDKLLVLNWNNYCRVNDLRSDQDAKIRAVTAQVANALEPVVREPADPANPPSTDDQFIEPHVIRAGAKKPEKRRKQRNVRPPVKG